MSHRNPLDVLDSRLDHNQETRETENRRYGAELPRERKTPILRETQAGLDTIKFPGLTEKQKQEAKRLLLEYVCENRTCTKAEIEKYQEAHNLSVDGIVGKETYYELKAEAVIKNACDHFEQYGLSLSTLQEMEALFPHLNPTSKNWARLWSLFCRFKKDAKFGPMRYKPWMQEIITRIDAIKAQKQKSPEIKKVKSSKQWKDFVDLYHDMEAWKISGWEFVKKIVTDPTMVMVWGLLFLFWVIGWDSKYTNSFMKRLGWIFGAMLFGPEVCHKIGCSKLFDAAAETAWDAAWAAVKWAKEWYNNAKPKVEQALEDMWEWLSNAWESVKDTFGVGENKEGKSFFKWLSFDDFKPSFLSVAWGIESKNKALEKTEQIPKENLKHLSWVLLSDKKFLLTTKWDLSKISKNNLKEYLTSQSLSTLTDKDREYITKYMSLLKQEFDADDTFVRDLFITKEVLDKIMSSLGDSYIKNLDLPVITKQDLLTLLNSPYKKDKIIAIDIISAFESKDPKKLDEIISVYWSNAKVANLNLNKVIDSIKNYLHDKEELEKLKTYFKKTLETEGAENQATLEAKLKLLDTYTDPFVLPEFKKKFEELKAQKKLEIFRKASNSNSKIKTLNWKNVDNYLQSLEAQIQQAEQQKYEEQKQEFNKEFWKIEVPSITEPKIDIPKYKDYNQKIQKAYDELNKLNPSNYFTNSWNNFAEFINSFANKNLVEKRSLSKIDKYKAGMIKTVLLELKKAQFDLEDKFDTSLAWLSISDIQEKWETIRGFKNEEVKNKKQEELKNEFEEQVNKKYIDRLEKATSITDLEKIKLEYDTLVDGLDSKLVWESVKKAYEKKFEELKRIEKENKKISEIAWITPLVVDLVQKYPQSIGIDAIKKLDPNKSTIKVLRVTLIDFKKLNTNNQELIGVIDNILNKIK